MSSSVDLAEKIRGGANTPARICVAGCPVDKLSLEEAVKELCYRLELRIRTHVVFVNAAKVVRCRQHPALRDVLERADLLLADGVPVVWASRLLGVPLPGRVNGTDLMERMLRAAAERGYRVYLLGARREVVTRTVVEIERRYPGVQVVGFHHGYFQESEEEILAREINASGADLILLGMSTPHKEFWGDRNLPRLGVAVCQGVGGSFDVLAGVVGRAPVWMQRSGLEWFYRLLQEPGRLWRRYLETNSAFIWLVLTDLASAWKARWAKNVS